MSSRRTVLVVDDGENTRRVLQHLVKQMGHTTLESATGVLALSAIKKATPDLILLDINMPCMDGISLLKIIKADENLRHIPVIVISDSDEMDDVSNCIELGAEDYLVKPPNLILLKALVCAGLAKKGLHDNEVRILQAAQHSNVHLRDRVLEKETALSQAYLDTLNRLIVAAEFKDEETGDHLVRISRYSVVIGRKSGLSEQEVQTLFHAAPLHDVGKIGIPDGILLKPGKLSDEEFDIMKKHTIIGSEILSNSDAESIQMAQTIALTHHERFNGQGYPHGLKGENIPLVGRVVAIVDSFDALTTKRPYKEPYPASIACKIIKNERAQRFDPQLVDLFLENLSEILEIKDEINGPEGSNAATFRWSERDQCAAIPQSLAGFAS